MNERCDSPASLATTLKLFRRTVFEISDNSATKASPSTWSGTSCIMSLEVILKLSGSAVDFFVEKAERNSRGARDISE